MTLQEHLLDRGMDVSLYNVSLDEEERVVTFFLYNLSGQLIGYQQYRPDVIEKGNGPPKTRRYFTYLKTDGVFGLEVKYPSNTIFIVEGVFKATKLHSLGYNAIAVLTSTPKRMKPWFFILGRKYKLIAIGDNDDGGRQLVNTVGHGFQSPEDLDEMTDESVIKLVGNYV